MMPALVRSWRRVIPDQTLVPSLAFAAWTARSATMGSSQLSINCTGPPGPRCTPGEGSNSISSLLLVPAPRGSRCAWKPPPENVAENWGAALIPRLDCRWKASAAAACTEFIAYPAPRVRPMGPLLSLKSVACRFSVGPAESHPSVTAIEPEPSAPGENVQVTVCVAEVIAPGKTPFRGDAALLKSCSKAEAACVRMVEERPLSQLPCSSARNSVAWPANC